MQDINEMRIYSAGDIAKILDISTNVARDFLDEASRHNLFSVVKVGVQYRVNATQFDEWNTYAKLHNVCNEGTGGCEMDRMLANPGSCSVYRPSDIQKILQLAYIKHKRSYLNFWMTQDMIPRFLLGLICVRHVYALV